MDQSVRSVNTVPGVSWKPYFSVRSYHHQAGRCPPLLRPARYFKIEDAVEPDDHAQAGKNVWGIPQWQAGQAKKPLWVEYGVHSPRQIIGTSQGKDTSVETPSYHHMWVF